MDMVLPNECTLAIVRTRVSDAGVEGMRCSCPMLSAVLACAGSDCELPESQPTFLRPMPKPQQESFFQKAVSESVSESRGVCSVRICRVGVGGARLCKVPSTLQ